MAHLTGTSGVTSVFATWINRKFTSDLMFSLQHQKFTMKGTIIPGSGANILRFNEFAPPGIAAAGTGAISYSGAGQATLTEGSTTANEITGITTTGTDCTMAEYGEFLKIGQLYEYAAVEGTRDRLRKRMMDGANASLDSAVRLQATQSTSIISASAAASGGVVGNAATLTSIGASTIMLGRKTLFSNLATGMDGIPGHPAGQYAAVITPTQELDIITEVTTSRVYWNNSVINVPGAMGQEKFVNGYIGSIYGVAVYTTNNFVTMSLTATGQLGFMYADGGVGAATIGQANPEIVFNDVNSPYKNVNSIAWHAYFGTKLLSSARVLRLYSSGA